AGLVVLSAFVSPLREQRERVKSIVGVDDFLEVYCRCPVEVCELRDPKGMYKKAKLGEIKEFTGMSSPYEEPENPDLILDTHILSVEESVEKVVKLIKENIL
ncbi:MAG: adenylyl-sulfate kinase, partial [Aquificaceae bacterium]